MTNKIKMRFSYVVEGYIASDNVDTYFYSHLPNVETEVFDIHSGRPVTDIPPPEQTISVTGSSIAAGATVAAIIKDYLQNKKTRIVIEGAKQQIEYKGPNLKTELGEIEKMIYNLTNDSCEDTITIMSYHLPESSEAV